MIGFTVISSLINLITALSLIFSLSVHSCTRTRLSVFSSRLPATDLNTETSASHHYKVFLLFRLQSHCNLRTKNTSGLTPPAYNWLVTALNWPCAEQSSSLLILPATSQHGHSWHQAPLGPMATYLFSVMTFVFFFCCSPFDKKGGVWLFYNWRSLTTPYSTQGHIKVGDIYILYIFIEHKLTLSSTTYRDICQCRIVQQLMPQLI
jgi:hypothetical protein